MNNSNPTSVDRAMIVDGEAHVASVAEIPIKNIWFMLLYAWDRPEILGRWQADVETAPSLVTLLARILARLVQQRLRIGLSRGYVEHQTEVAGVRGRIVFSDTLRRLALQHGRTSCRYSIFTPDVLANRVIRCTLVRLLQFGGLGPGSEDLRAHLRGLVYATDCVTLADVDLADISRAQSQRQDRDYTLMLAICRLLHEGLMPTETAGESALPSAPRSHFTLHAVFEKFVARFYQEHLNEWRVTPQSRIAWPSDGALAFLPSMRPDIVLQHRETNKVVVVDTKFTPHALRKSQYGRERFASSHLYQMYAYLRTQEEVSNFHADATGILLYPTVGFDLSEEARIQGHRIRWETVDLSLDWRAIDERLREVIGWNQDG